MSHSISHFIGPKGTLGFPFYTGLSPNLPDSGLSITTHLIAQVRSLEVVPQDFPPLPANPVGSTLSVPPKCVHSSLFLLTASRPSPFHSFVPGLL